MSDVKVTTNNVPRDVIDAWELTAAEREEFDYIDWQAIEAGNDSASFVRYKGELHDLGEFVIPPSSLAEWDGCRSDAFYFRSSRALR